VHDHEIYDDTPSSYLDDIADIEEKHIRLSYPNFILLLARLDTDYNYAQYLVRCLYANHLADELRHPNMSGYLEEQDELSNALRHFRVTIPGIIARRTQLTELLKKQPNKSSRLARGMPLGSELEYVDAGTLAQAVYERQLLQEKKDTPC